jgi:hypothetical protein
VAAGRGMFNIVNSIGQSGFLIIENRKVLQFKLSGFYGLEPILYECAFFISFFFFFNMFTQEMGKRFELVTFASLCVIPTD